MMLGKFKAILLVSALVILPLSAQGGGKQTATRSVQGRAKVIENQRLVNHNRNLATKSEANREYTLAIAYYKIAIQLEPRMRSIHADLGRVYEKIGRKGDAFAAYKNAYIVPSGERGTPASDLIGLCRFGDLCLELGYPAEAKTVYERFALFNKWPNDILMKPLPRDSSSRALRAHSYLVIAADRRHKGFENELVALDFTDQALSLAPKDWVALHMKGLILGRLRRKEEAMASFGQAMRLAPKSVYASLRGQARRAKLIGGSSTVISHPDGSTEYRTVVIYPDGTKEESVRFTPRRRP